MHCLRRLLSATQRLVGLEGFSWLPCFALLLLAADEAALLALRKYGCIFSPIDFLQLRSTNSGTAPCSLCLPQTSWGWCRNVFSGVSAGKSLQEHRFTHPRSALVGQGDDTELQWTWSPCLRDFTLHMPEKWSNWTSRVSEGWGNSTARTIWQEIYELARQHRTEIHLRNGDVLPWAGFLWTRSSFSLHLASVPILASASLQRPLGLISGSGTKEQHSSSSRNLSNVFSLCQLLTSSGQVTPRPPPDQNQARETTGKPALGASSKHGALRLVTLKGLIPWAATSLGFPTFHFQQKHDFVMSPLKTDLCVQNHS